jgi:uncharacterized coiled-coil protein SlyX
MNQLAGKKEREAFNKAFPAALTGRNENGLGELSLSGTHEQSLPFLTTASQFGAKVVEFAVKPVIDYDRKISKKVLAAMAGDPDPVKTLADIRGLLVGPTRGLHDAMFEEVVDILEESDREVKGALVSLESRYFRLSDIADELVSASRESLEQNRHQVQFFQEELQKSVAAQQDMLAEMFLAIDAKLEELTTQFNRKIEGVANKLEAARHAAAASQEKANQALEARFLASSGEALAHMEKRLDHLERKSSADQAVIREVFADGLLNIADRFKHLHQNRL